LVGALSARRRGWSAARRGLRCVGGLSRGRSPFGGSGRAARQDEHHRSTVKDPVAPDAAAIHVVAPLVVRAGFVQFGPVSPYLLGVNVCIGHRLNPSAAKCRRRMARRMAVASASDRWSSQIRRVALRQIRSSRRTPTGRMRPRTHRESWRGAWRNGGIPSTAARVSSGSVPAGSSANEAHSSESVVTTFHDTSSSLVCRQRWSTSAHDRSGLLWTGNAGRVAT
jgi:hypothetical protein